MIDPLHAMLGYQLRRTSVAVMSALADELAPLEINPGEASLLMVIGANHGCTQSDISRALRARPANLVPLINKLVMSGALERAPGKGRAIALSLSKAGEILYAKVERIFDDHEARIGRSVPADRRAELVELLRRIGDDACIAMHCAARDA
ncbi:MarR family winged helix-turn-helix transcriptional regulator [Sphingomonas sp. LaA6.9]|uniref:MarR family winged helix-turn-helix transcriptional regulator n=1 Tax=Sphingomonas sp. LaA6.9 TaxID=2919914 RepID=UPI001F4F7589|nr:MarR family transcriptional regulator [Sphingomonas sp. LaA6.9]MCJ8156138.1 MarR family transcriptional regulator [Sphingomonas sp. LaA6.9]